MNNLYKKHIKLQWQIIKKMSKLLERYTLRDIQHATQFDNAYLKFLYNCVPFIYLAQSLPPSFTQELSSVISQKDIKKLVKHYQSQKPTLTQWRQHIRQSQSRYKKDNIKVPQAKLNKSLFFIKRQLYTSNAEMKTVILNQLNNTISDNTPS